MGNWTVNKVNFPIGLKPVSDAIDKVGAKFILWFEPERVVAGTQFDQLNPDFLIRIPDTVKNPEIGRFLSNMSLFNLGNPAAREWLTYYISDLSLTYGLNFCLPLHGAGNTTPTKYAFRSSMRSAMVTIWDLNNPAWPQTEMQFIMQDYKRLRPYYYGDYYPLTPNINITSDTIWLAYQQNRPDQGDGIIMAFRRPDCKSEQVTVKPRGLESDADYTLLFEDKGVEQLHQGLK